VATVLVMNLVGAAVAGLLRGNPEVHLAGALVVGAVAFLSGVFPVPERLAWLVEAIAPANPVAGLARTIRGMAEGSASGAGAWSTVGAIVLGTFLLAVAVRGLNLWGGGSRSSARETEA
jgi:hypothetical protein